MVGSQLCFADYLLLYKIIFFIFNTVEKIAFVDYNSSICV